jgi:hypothetical protein
MIVTAFNMNLEIRSLKMIITIIAVYNNATTVTD